MDKRKAVVPVLVEGVSINATVRMTGVGKPTILRLLCKLGVACSDHHDGCIRGLKPEYAPTDKTWSFNYCKEMNVAKAKAAPADAGDIWMWTAIDAQSKLISSYRVGLRTPDDAAAFMLDLAGQITNITQLTTDGLAAYPPAVYEAFGDEATGADHARYSPADCVGCRKKYVIGAADRDHISTS